MPADMMNFALNVIQLQERQQAAEAERAALERQRQVDALLKQQENARQQGDFEARQKEAALRYENNAQTQMAAAASGMPAVIPKDAKGLTPEFLNQFKRPMDMSIEGLKDADVTRPDATSLGRLVDNGDVFVFVPNVGAHQARALDRIQRDKDMAIVELSKQKMEFEYKQAQTNAVKNRTARFTPRPTTQAVQAARFGIGIYNTRITPELESMRVDPTRSVEFIAAQKDPASLLPPEDAEKYRSLFNVITRAALEDPTGPFTTDPTTGQIDNFDDDVEIHNAAAAHFGIPGVDAPAQPQAQPTAPGSRATPKSSAPPPPSAADNAAAAQQRRERKQALLNKIRAGHATKEEIDEAASLVPKAK